MLCIQFARMKDNILIYLLSPTSLNPFQALDSENAEVVATRELGIELGDAGLAGITDKGRKNRIRRANQSIYQQ